ncbi:MULTISPECIES: hypothetical protein [Psychrilyobacter]|uniref:Outer membrane protein beta-barrel domain-containing protein n=1 Tax=Psychrilyobacter piezotolerans TaxID=2293438 RepID=A0ABX9KKR8_9FUSO|nr:MULTISPECIES: hypothetical protein [Psychrilyobacter]MCS5421067.1 hypothetical protein [Psychrilyobacter sp. S5]NDI76369.1 hypothetical protein [Psychrilyobacter piezotolerans]RDE65967.1 hypothetical protein DV867_00390 [Psychrilyobacter sp. S5]REI43145.1 hypothetical protein DYH56_00390 [Psychrilyobacter piezotolerans]
MKKLLLLAAILAIGSTAFAVSAGISLNGPDALYGPSIKLNAEAGHAGGFNAYRDITTGDNAIHNNRAVNIFRDKGPGWTDTAMTKVYLNVLRPIRIDSEVDYLYTEAVVGDELQIGDIGFRVAGQGLATVVFSFHGPVFDLPGKVTIKDHGLFTYTQTRNLGAGVEVAGRFVYLGLGVKEIEIDAYFKKLTTPGLKSGTIFAIAQYQ